MRRICAAAALSILAVQGVAGEEGLLAETLAANRYLLQIEDGTLAGPGRDFLVTATQDAQFVAYAEPHNVKEVPEYFAALLRLLHSDHGFQYVALETGPFILELAGSEPARTSLSGLRSLYARYPSSFHFYTDQELEMIAAVGEVSDAPSPPVWGVDQVHDPVVVLDLLLDATTDGKKQALVKEALAEVQEHDNARAINEPRLLLTDTDVFENLAAQYNAAPGSREAFLLDQLLLSYGIYWDNRHAGEERVGYRSNDVREQNMKDLFMHHYRRAQAAGIEAPKVLAKLGHMHLMKGRNPLNVYTLGNFLLEFARANGHDAFHITVSIVNEPDTRYWSLSENPAYAPLTDLVPVDTTMLFDLRPLRPLIHAGAIELAPELEAWAFQYDAALLIGGAQRGSYRYEAERRRAERHKED